MPDGGAAFLYIVAELRTFEIFNDKGAFGARGAIAYPVDFFNLIVDGKIVFYLRQVAGLGAFEESLDMDAAILRAFYFLDNFEIFGDAIRRCHVNAAVIGDKRTHAHYLDAGVSCVALEGFIFVVDAKLHLVVGIVVGDQKFAEAFVEQVVDKAVLFAGDDLSKACAADFTFL